MNREELEKAIQQNGSASAVLLTEMLKHTSNMPFASCKKIVPYLYELSYNDLDYEFGKNYAAERFISSGRCSVVQNGNLIGRNLDMLYDNSVTAVVRVAASNSRYASIGLVSGMSTLTEQLLASGKYDSALKAAPFFVTDAINELFGVHETPELEVSMTQTNAQRKVIYDECVKHPPLAKNIVFYNMSDAMYYRVNGYNLINNVLHLHAIMQGEGGTLRSVVVQIGSNGSISVI